MIIRVFLVITFILINNSTGLTQNENLKEDEHFFKRQENVYQNWLNHSGLGKVLKTHSIWVKPDKLILYIKFPFNDTDSVTNAWNHLKKEFELRSPLTLEQTLFYKMVSFMDIRQSLAEIQLYDTYDTNEEYCFKRKIYFSDGKLIVDIESCKAKIRNINFDFDDFSQRKTKSVFNYKNSDNTRNISSSQQSNLIPKEAVYNKIYNYAKSKYEKTICENRNPKVTLINSKGVLRFRVVDLCMEVLDEDNPKTCKVLRWFGHDCNWIKRERLIFTFVYLETDHGFDIYTIIDGAYGSGFYDKVKRGGYHNMEVDFDEELENYADEFKEEIRALILNM